MRALRAVFFPLFRALGCKPTEPAPTEAPSAATATSASPESTAPASAAPPPRPATAARSVWAAEYDYEWSSARGPSGVAPVVSYQIVVEHAGDAYGVSISADGTQTMIRMKGTGRVDGDKLRVLFAECGKEDMFKCNTVKPGDLLLTLNRQRGGVWLEFGKMSAPDGKTRELSPVNPKM